MIRNIIFDIGNVLTDFRWREFLKDKGFHGEKLEQIAAASVLHPVWGELDRGVWSAEQVIDGFVKNAPELEADLHLAYDDMTDMVTLRDYAVEWVKELKTKGFHVYYLSNFSYKVEVECSESLAFLPYMDGGILSYKEHLIKPDPAIYQLLLSRYGLEADESVFLDDTEANILAARQQGIHGIVFVNKEQAISELKKMGANV